MQCGSALLNCALIEGDSQKALEIISKRTEQLARQAVHANAAALYMLDPRSKRAITISHPVGFRNEESFELRDSNTVWTALRATPWRQVQSPCQP